MSVALTDLYARLGLRVDRSSFQRGRAEMRRLGDEAEQTGSRAGGALAKIGDGIKTAFGFDLYGMLRGAATQIAGMFAGGMRYNASLEESTTKIAGMLALAGGTKFSDEISTANNLMKELSERAAKLPGTTAEYVQMLGNITQPVRQAGLGVEELTDLTVGAVVAAKALGEDAGAAARDIGQALRGQAGADDPFIGKLLDTRGYTGEDGRRRFNQSSAKKRAEIVKDLLKSPQLVEMAAAQGGLMSGVKSTLEDNVSRFFAASTKGLFDGVKTTITAINTWVERHADTIARVTSAISAGITWAYRRAQDGVRLLARAAGFVADRVREYFDAVAGDGQGMTTIGEKLREVLLNVWATIKTVAETVGRVLGVVWRMAIGVVRITSRIRDVIVGVLEKLGLFRASAEGTAGAFGGAKDALDQIAGVLDHIADLVDGMTSVTLWMIDRLGEALHAVIDPIVEAVEWVLAKIPGGGTVGFSGSVRARATEDGGIAGTIGLSDTVAPALELGPWGSPVTGSNTTNNTTINVHSTAPAADVAREVDAQLAKRLRGAAATARSR